MTVATLVQHCKGLGRPRSRRPRHRRLRDLALASTLALIVGMLTVALGPAPAAQAVTGPQYDSFSLGYQEACAVTSDGHVQCWGAPSDGRLSGSDKVIGSTGALTVPGVGGVGTLDDITQVAVNTYDYGDGVHICATGGGAVYCWGYNGYGQLGNGGGTDSGTPVQVVGVGGTGTLSGVVKVVVNNDSSGTTCALSGAGAVYCWGYNGYGQLGDGTTTDSPTPVQVQGVGGTGTLAGITDITMGGTSVCALAGSGAVYCWGDNGDGQLGDNTTNMRTSPVQVVGVGGTGTLSGVTSIEMSNDEDYTCAVTGAGAGYCWGSNYSGQLGDNTTTQRNAPVQVVGVGGTGTLSGITKLVLAMGERQTCALTTSGALYCWGQNYSGMLGDGTTTRRSAPVQVVGVGGTGTLSGVVDVSMGAETSCATTASGQAYCWGYNSYGTLGDGTTNDSSTPVQVSGPGGTGTLSGVDGVVVSGNSYACASTVDGGYCWGNNYEAQLANGDTQPEQVDYPQAIGQFVPLGAQDGLDGVTDLGDASQGTTTCAIGNGGTVYCWGQGSNGELGNGTTNGSRSRVQVVSPDGTGQLTGIQKLAYGSNVVCGVHADTTVYCWGLNDRGQLGNGTTASSDVPVHVHGVGGSGFLSGIVDVVTEAPTTVCALDADGHVFCWGRGDRGQLGVNSSSDSSTPVQVKDPAGTGVLSNIEQIHGDNWATCAISLAGAAYCWGDNTYGVLGNGTTAAQHLPAQVVGVGGTGFLTGVTDITDAIDGGFQCAVANGNVYCWGSNYTGQLGNGTTSDSTTPVQVLGVGGTGFLTGIVHVTHNGNGDACALSVAGTAYCWGNNGGGQLGNGTTTTSSTPVQVHGVGGTGTLSGISHLATTANYSCAIIADGNVACWGGNSNGQVGTGSVDNVLVPTLVKGPDGVGTLDDVAQLSLPDGSSNSCALTGSGVVYCWGYNYYGITGNPWAISTTVPYGVATPTSSMPTAAHATAGGGQATVTWHVPTRAGSSPITGYVITPYIDGVPQAPVTSSGTGTTYTVTGLTPGTPYTFTVQAQSSDGLSSASVESNQVTPFVAPGPTSTPVATAGAGQASLTWNAPGTGGPFIGYRITPYIGGVAQAPVTSMGTGTSYTVTGLTNGTTYTFTVTAMNSGGDGPESSPSNAVTPTAPPGSVANLAATGTSTDRSVVSWSPPTDTGGLPIVSYTLKYKKASDSSWTTVSTSATSPTTLPGLTSSTAYVVQVTAVNSQGNGVDTTVAFTTLATMPSPAPSLPIAVVDGNVVTVPSYTPPSAAVGVAATPTAGGSWTATADGGVFTAGDAGFFGSMGGTRLNAPMVGIAPTPTGTGYLLVGADGGVFAYGDANFHGSMGGHPLNQPITAISSTCSNSGYYLVANDGGVFAFGDAQFHGSMAGISLNQGMLGIVPACDNSGYWTYAKDGGVFTFGGAHFYGSLGSNPPAGGIVGMVSAPDGHGYWLIGADHKAYAFGSAMPG